MRDLYLLSSYALAFLLFLSIIASITMFIAAIRILARRPVCLTDLCEPEIEIKSDKEDDDKTSEDKSSA